MGIHIAKLNLNPLSYLYFFKYSN